MWPEEGAVLRLPVELTVTTAATNATAEGQAENRRVVVTIVVNKGVAGS